MNSAYQVQPTHYANHALYSGHAIVNDLCARADRLAPRFSYETLEAGASNPRPGNDQPRRQQVWDMHAEALSWNMIADRPEVVAYAIGFEVHGVEYLAAYAFDGDQVALITGYDVKPTLNESIEILRVTPGTGPVIYVAAPKVVTVDHNPAHNPDVDLWNCPCKECTLLDFKAADSTLSLAQWRRQQFPEIYGQTLAVVPTWSRP